MRSSVITTVLLSAACVRALQITSPAKNEKVNLADSSYTVKFERVSSDPDSAHLFLVNQQGGHTPYSKDLGEVDLSKGSYTVNKIDDLPADTGYQFNLQSVVTTNMGILAQSEQFQVVKAENDKPSTPISAPSSDATTAKTSSTATPTPLLNPSGMPNATETSTATAVVSGAVTPTRGGSPTRSSATPSSTPVKGGAGNLVVDGLLALALGLIALV